MTELFLQKGFQMTRVFRFFGKHPDSSWEPVGIYGGVVSRSFFDKFENESGQFADFLASAPRDVFTRFRR